jgi:hypothetical protein
MGAASDARLLVALAAVKEHIGRVDAETRARLGAELTAGGKMPVYTADSIEVGVAQRPADTTVARVADRAAWLAWVSEHHPESVREVRPPPLKSDTQDLALLAALTNVLARTQDEWGGCTPETVLDDLRAAGYAVVPADGPGHLEVYPAFEQTVLKASQAAATPLVPGGEVPDGIGVDQTPNAPRVTVTKDTAVQAALIREMRHQLRAITAGDDNKGDGDG